MLQPVEVLAKIEKVSRESSFTARIGDRRPGERQSILFGDEVRPLSSDEISVLTKNRNVCDAWDKIRVHPEFGPEGIYDSLFMGNVVLGKMRTGEQNTTGNAVPQPGIYRCTIAGSEIGNNVTLNNVGLINRTVVEDNVSILSCGTIFCEGKTTYGNGTEVIIAVETGGREVVVFAEMTLGIAETVARKRGDKEFQERRRALVSEYVSKTENTMTIICEGSRIASTPRLENVYIGPNAVITAAQSITNSTILSSKEEPVVIKDGALVDSSIIQWGCEVASMAIVSSSLLCEHSHVERHGKVNHSIIGSNTGIGEGEVTSSLVGPFVGFHHQALLIAAFWPEGKGNIAYGANVGSNHTGRAPDQEIWCGEGTFFGLGCSIKFPADYSRAPYSIIATGVTTLPQKVEFPFSLINTPVDRLARIPPAFNEIRPGWVVAENMYALYRNEAKFKDRNKSKRESIGYEILRPDIVDLMVEARRRLSEAKPKAEGGYTERDIAGLGKNFLVEPARRRGIEIYTFAIGLYALRGLFKRISGLPDGEKEKAAGILSKETEDPRWEHERRTLVVEFGGRPVRELLMELISREKEIAELVESSKARDDERGARIIDDYAEAHRPTSDDKVVRLVKTHAAKIEEEVNDLIKRLG